MASHQTVSRSRACKEKKEKSIQRDPRDLTLSYLIWFCSTFHQNKNLITHANGYQNFIAFYVTVSVWDQRNTTIFNYYPIHCLRHSEWLVLVIAQIFKWLDDYMNECRIKSDIIMCRIKRFSLGYESNNQNANTEMSLALNLAGSN